MVTTRRLASVATTTATTTRIITIIDGTFMPSKCYSMILLFCISSALVAETRHAMIIGINKYPGHELHNAENDAVAMAKGLGDQGYVTTVLLDADRETMIGAINLFADSLKTGDTALLYYAGHGLQVAGENYLVPVDFTVTTPEMVPEQGVALSLLLNILSSHGASTEIVILDACRDNPFLGTRSLKGGWAPIGTSAGMFLAFGTSPGSTASDDPQSTHGLFTGLLLPLISQSGLEIEPMFRELRTRVIQQSGGAQIPWTASSLIGAFHIRPDLDAQQRPLAPIDETSSMSTTHIRSLIGSAGAKETPTSRSLPLEEMHDMDRAIGLAKAGHFADAIGVLQHVLSLWPQAGVALKLLGLLLHYVGRDLEAIHAFDRAIVLNDASVSSDAASYKCALEGLQGSKDAAGDCYAAAQAYPTADSQLALAALLDLKGEDVAAYKAVLQAVAQRQTGLGFSLKGIIEAKLGHRAEAAESYQRAVGIAIGSAQ